MCKDLGTRFTAEQWFMFDLDLARWAFRSNPWVAGNSKLSRGLQK